MINVLITAYRAVRGPGRGFAVTHAEDHVRRVLDVTGVLPTRTADQGAPHGAETVSA